MGCDIHTFIEYSDFNDHETGEPYWQCFGGQINTGRNYTLFGVLAGVRDDSHQLFSPRGLPEGKLSWEVDDYMRIRIADEGEEPTENEVSLEKAQEWTRGRYGETIIELNGKPRWVTNPDLHSHSWLTLGELKHALAHYMVGERAEKIEVPEPDRHVVLVATAALDGRGMSYDPRWDAVVAAMTAFAARGAQTRLIFCFDN